MPVTDPIADMLSRIRNAQLVQHQTVEMPSSGSKVAIAELLEREGFVENVEVVRQLPQDTLRLRLKYGIDRKPAIAGMRRVSKPGLRVHVGRREVPRFFGGLGISIVSTSRGVMTGRDAWRKGIGGELLCYVW